MAKYLAIVLAFILLLIHELTPLALRYVDSLIELPSECPGLTDRAMYGLTAPARTQ